MARARVFKAMSHPSRMHIVSLLESGPRNVGELTDAIGCDITTVSKHLSIMRSAGIVIDETRGRSVYYSLYCSCIPRFIRCVDEIVSVKAVRAPARFVHADADTGRRAIRI